MVYITYAKLNVKLDWTILCFMMFLPKEHAVVLNRPKKVPYILILLHNYNSFYALKFSIHKCLGSVVCNTCEHIRLYKSTMII